MTGAAQGVYCLANDAVLEPFQAFVESLRAVSPAVPLVVIPFDERTVGLSRLSTRYGFDLLSSGSLDELDAIGRQVSFGGHIAVHAFRKLAVFQGPFDRFLFLDSDIVVLEPVEELLGLYARSRGFLCFDDDLDQVYDPGPFRDRMVGQGSIGFNTGAFVCERSLFTLEDIRQAADEALTARSSFVAATLEQPFFNFLLDRDPRRRCRPTRHRDLVPGYGGTWAGQARARASGDEVLLVDPLTGEPKRAVFVHWAGFSNHPGMPHWDLFLRYRLRSEPRAAMRLAYRSRRMAQHVKAKVEGRLRKVLGPLKRSLESRGLRS